MASRKRLLSRVLFTTTGIPVALVFFDALMGMDIEGAFQSAMDMFFRSETAIVLWLIIALTNTAILISIRPILAFIFCNEGPRRAQLAVRDRAMVAFNRLPAMIFIISIAGNVLGTIAEFAFGSTHSFYNGPFIWELMTNTATGLLMGSFIMFNLEVVLFPAKKILIESGPGVPQARKSLYQKISIAIISLLLFLTFHLFSVSSSFMAVFLVSSPNQIPPSMVGDSGNFFDLGAMNGMREAFELQGFRLILFILFSFHMIRLIKMQFQGPLQEIQDHLEDLNSDRIVNVRQIDIVNNDEFASVFKEINTLIARQQGELATSMGRLDDLVKTAADAIVSFDQDGYIHVLNPAFEELFGYNVDQLRSKTLASIFAMDPEFQDRCHHDPKLIVEHLEQIVDKPFRMEAKSSQGRTFTMEANYSIASKGTGERIYTMIIRDVSAQVEFEESLVRARSAAEEANQLKSEFLANMSHELRTPLNAVLGFTQLMADDKNLTDSQRTKLSTINRSGEHLLGLINDILDISKIEAGKFELHSEVFDLESFADDLREMFSLKCEKKGLTLYFEKLDQLPHYVRGDLGKLRQIMINLMGNAVKFTDEGGIRVAMGMDQGKIRFAIGDTGRGIAPEDLDNITKPFTQTGTVKHEAGTGLGLAITSRFIQMMGGKLDIESELGKGSTFSFALELEAADRGPDTLTNSAPVLSLQTPGAKALVVDDKLNNRLILKEMLERVGFTTAEAADGAEAIVRSQEFSPQVIFMDIKMPGVDGYEAVERLKSDPELQKIPVFALTASAFKHDEQRILSSGFDGFLAKPFKQPALFQLIAEKTELQFIYDEHNREGDDEYGAPMEASWRELSPSDRSFGMERDLLIEIKDAVEINDFARVSQLVGTLAGTIHPAVEREFLDASASFDDGRLSELVEAIESDRGAISGH